MKTEVSGSEMEKPLTKAEFDTAAAELVAQVAGKLRPEEVGMIRSAVLRVLKRKVTTRFVAKARAQALRRIAWDIERGVEQSKPQTQEGA